MRLLRVEIERFRGIQQLCWGVGGDFACLIGPGDSTKTTILDAIELTLSPWWNVNFDDTDFFDTKTGDPFSITVTVGDLPQDLKSEAKFGLLARGWSPTGELHDEPEDGDELVLSIQLQVTSSLEPHWAVVNGRQPEGKSIGARDRERFGCVQLGSFVDRHFIWGRGSILSRVTGEGDSVAGILASAGRAARAQVAGIEAGGFAELNSAARNAQSAGEDLGVAPRNGYHPNLDVKSVSLGAGGLSLHDGEVPLRRAGLGTRRLLAVAMQRELSTERGLSLIDEIEHGLEPHRIRHLLTVLRGSEGGNSHAQVLLTTHSPVVVEELGVEHLRLVRTENGVTTVVYVPTELQPVVRKASEAFLAKKVLVCEGRTELGFCRRLDRWWAESGPSFALMGVALADGGGSEAAKVTHAFAHLGYEVALLADSDRALDPDAPALELAGARVLLWRGEVAIEQRIVLDLPWVGVADLVGLAMGEWGKQSVRDAVQCRLAAGGPVLGDDPNDWPNQVDDGELRVAVGVGARGAKKNRGWFKRINLAEKLAEIVVTHYDALSGTQLRLTIDDLREWAHGDG